MASVNVKFTANTANLQKGIGAVKGAIAGLSTMAASVMAPLAAIVGVGAAIGAAFKGISLAADMEQTEVAFSTLLGSMEKAKALLGELKTLGAKTPFEFPDLAQAARSLLAGGQQEGITETLTRIGDLAATAQKPIADLAAMYSKIKGGGVIQGEDLNQLTDAGIPILKEFSSMLGVSVMQVRKLGSQGKLTGDMLDQAFTNMTSKGGIAFQAMEKQSATFTGLLSTLRDNWNMLLAEFGKPIMMALKPLLSEGITLIEGMQQKAREFGEAVAKAITFLFRAFKGGELFSLAGKALAVAAMGFVNIILKGVQGAGAVLYNVFTTIGGMFYEMFTSESLWKTVDAKIASLGYSIAKIIDGLLPQTPDDRAEGQRNFQALKESEDRKAAAFTRNGNHADIFARAGEELKRSGEIFSEAMKGKNAINISKELKELQDRWKALTQEIKTNTEATTDKATGKDTKPKATLADPQAMKEQFQPVISSLARIGGASGLTKNPLVALTTTMVERLDKIVANTGRLNFAVAG